MPIKRISVFGNEDLAIDSLPLKILPKLQEKFPIVEFVVEDPNELHMPDTEEWIIIDTVAGLREVRLLNIEDIKQLTKNKVSMHDFDLGMHLFWIKKIKKNTDIKIIGIPQNISAQKATKETIKFLATLLLKNEQRN